MKRYPFLIIVDDAGFKVIGNKNQECNTNMDIYGTILKIAKKFSIKIPVCITMKYLDKENISGCGAPLGYADDLIDFMKKNKEHIEIGYHGLTHEYKNHIGEFYCLDINNIVPEKIQREHIEKSAKIFDYWDLNFPELFVPPYHAWEIDVTDKILSEYGVKYLVSLEKLKYNNHAYKWDTSRHLTFLPRTDIGIYSEQININKVQLNVAKKRILPRTILNNLLSPRSVSNKPVHSYMTHLGNFMPQNYYFWVELLNYVKNNPKLEICHDNYNAVEAFLLWQGQE